jgi:hypothetical protein
MAVEDGGTTAFDQSGDSLSLAVNGLRALALAG